MFSFVYRICKVLSNTLYLISMTLVVGLMLLTTVDVIGRYFGHAVLGSYQISELIQVWVICLAWPLSIVVKSHVRVEVVISYAPPLLKKLSELSSNIAIICIFLLIGWQGIKNVLMSKEINDVVSIVDIPLYPFKLAVPIGAFVACFVVIILMIEDLRGEKEERGFQK